MQYLSRIAPKRGADFVADIPSACATHKRAHKISINETLRIFKEVRAFA
jgi:hypothetical protein